MWESADSMANLPRGQCRSVGNGKTLAMQHEKVEVKDPITSNLSFKNIGREGWKDGSLLRGLSHLPEDLSLNPHDSSQPSVIPVLLPDPMPFSDFCGHEACM